jgi:hypothetical protein
MPVARALANAQGDVETSSVRAESWQAETESPLPGMI